MTRYDRRRTFNHTSRIRGGFDIPPHLQELFGFSQSVCAHTCKEIVKREHDVEIGTGQDGSVETQTETDYFERCMTCGAITREHAEPMEDK